MTYTEILDHIKAENDEIYIAGKVDEYVPEYVWDWEDDYDDIHEAYEETGRGQAEHQILNEVIALAADKLGLKFTTELHCDLFDDLAAHWELNTD